MSRLSVEIIHPKNADVKRVEFTRLADSVKEKGE